MSPKRILIVEDEPVTLMDEVSVLQELGYAIAGSAFSGEVAIELAEKEHPDVVLMDILLSTNMSGLDAAMKIRRRFAIPVVFVSALGQQEQFGPDKNRPQKGVRYIVKPFQPAQLGAAIEAVLAETP